MNDRLMTIYERVRRSLYLFDYPGINLNVEDVVDKEHIVRGIKLIIYIPNAQIQKCLGKWQIMQNAYKYRKR